MAGIQRSRCTMLNNLLLNGAFLASLVWLASGLQAQSISGAIIGEALRYNLSPTRFNWGDSWVSAWSSDNKLYCTADDTKGFQNEFYPSGRNLILSSFDETNPQDLLGRTVNSMTIFGTEGQSVEEQGVDGRYYQFTWKANGLTSIDGVLYMSVSRHAYGANFSDLRQRAKDANIIKSIDYGLTWQPLPALQAQPYASHEVMFAGDKFATPVFIEYGQDGQPPKPVPDQADEYVYAVSNNGFWNNGDHVYLGRVHKVDLPNLDASQWQFVAALIEGTPVWGSLNEAQPILSATRQLSVGGVVYVPAFRKYVMPQWHYPELPDTCGPIPPPWPGPPHPEPNYVNPFVTCIKQTSWHFYQADHPWGPWQLFHVENYIDRNTDSIGMGFYNPTIPNKFIASTVRQVKDEEHLDMWILTAGNFMTYAQEPEQNPFGYFDWSTTRYTLHILPLTLIRPK